MVQQNVEFSLTIEDITYPNLSRKRSNILGNPYMECYLILIATLLGRLFVSFVDYESKVHQC